MKLESGRIFPISASQRVYIVDDDSMVRRSLFLSLKTAGFEVRSFASGTDFLDEVDILDFGCILLDIRMPEKDGVAVLQDLGEKIRRFAVIMITGHGDVDVAVRTMKMGAADFLEKPFTDADLLEVLHNVFEQLPAQAEADMMRAEAEARVAKLTIRQREVLQGLVSGVSNRCAAEQMGISHRTVEIHRANLMKQLDANSVGEAVRLAISAGVKPK